MHLSLCATRPQPYVSLRLLGDHRTDSYGSQVVSAHAVVCGIHDAHIHEHPQIFLHPHNHELNVRDDMDILMSPSTVKLMPVSVLMLRSQNEAHLFLSTMQLHVASPLLLVV